jgi:hypothetical protein
MVKKKLRGRALPETVGPHICLEMPLPPQLMLDAAERAIAEDPQNATAGQVAIERRPGLEPSSLEMFGALLTGKRWKNGRTLRVRHLDGDPAIQVKVEAYAKIWEQFANLQLDFGAHAQAEIRISYYLDHQSWSYIGTDALSVLEPEHTMHYGWLKPDTDEAEIRRVVMHEFGHALGMIHEHQHPEHKIEWDRQAVYNHYVDRLKWTKQRVDHNLFAAEERGETQFSAYDPLSIMHYPVPAEFTTDRCAVGWNRDLSETDKNFIRQIYPKQPPAGVMGAPPQALTAGADTGMITRHWG